MLNGAVPLPHTDTHQEPFLYAFVHNWGHCNKIPAFNLDYLSELISYFLVEIEQILHFVCVR